MEGKKKFSGYIVLVGCILVFISGSCPMGQFSRFIAPVCDELGLARSLFSVISTFYLGITGIVCIFYGKLQKKFSLKVLILIGVICGALGYIIWSFSGELWQFYAGGVLIGIGCGLSQMVPLNAIVTNWFVKRRGLYVGMLNGFLALGAVCFGPVVSGLLESMGWRTTWMIFGIFLAVCSFIGWLLITEKPSMKGQMALGEGEASSEGGAASTEAIYGVTAQEARRTKSFWLLIFGIALMCAAIQGVFFGISPSMTDNGVPVAVVGIATSVMFAVRFLSDTVLGGLSDKYGMKIVFILMLIGIVGGTLIVNSASGAIMPLVGAGLVGIALCAMSIVHPLMINTLFGNLDYATLMAQVTIAYYIGISTGGPIINIFYDMQGNYTAGFITMIAVFIVSVVMMIIGIKSRPKHHA